jgi:hypothetical protein
VTDTKNYLSLGFAKNEKQIPLVPTFTFCEKIKNESDYWLGGTMLAFCLFVINVVNLTTDY